MTGGGADAETLAPALPAKIVDRAVHLLKEADRAGLGIATAESCTGGLLASLLTDIEGASKAFERGFIVYSEAAKCELLGLSQALIDDHGAVSKEVACAMARGALARSHADVALAITGFAGPAGPDDETGLVHLACARRQGPTAHEERHFGDIGRGRTRIESLSVALAMLEAAILHHDRRD